MKTLLILVVLMAYGAAPPVSCSESDETGTLERAVGIRRIANMPDGAPAFELRNLEGTLVSRIECIDNGWYETDELSARLLGSREFMAVLVAKNARLDVTEIGPASFNCVVVDLGQACQPPLGVKQN